MRAATRVQLFSSLPCGGCYSTNVDLDPSSGVATTDRFLGGHEQRAEGIRRNAGGAPAGVSQRALRKRKVL